MPAPALREIRDAVLARPGLVGAPLRAQLTAGYDRWLSALLPRCDGIALAAVGGLGRREPAPYSDLDLVLLHDGHVDELAKLADAVWYPIWDSGLSLDHAVRTVPQAVTVAKTDLKAMLGLLYVRHVGGDPALTARVRGDVLNAWRASAHKRFRELREITRARWAVAGDAAFLLEPNLKEARGGLRDVHALQALAAAHLVDVPTAVREKYALLLDVRGELHRASGRADDVLHHESHDDVAAALSVADEGSDEARDVLLRRVNEAARTIGHALETAERRITATEHAHRRRRFGIAGPVSTRIGLARDVVAHGVEVTLARDADPTSDPGLLLRVARAAAEQELPIAAFTLGRLAAESAPLPRPWPPEARADFLAVLGAGPAGVVVLESLDHAGLLVRLIPEWDAVRCRPQHNPVHRFTVDRHLLETAAAAAAQDAGVERRDLLLLGALLHDIGKGYPGTDHSVTGAQRAAVIAERIGLAPADVDTVVSLVRHHLLLPNTATRRDLDDPRTVQIVRDATGNSIELLDLLHALTVADAAATGPAAWGDWKAALVADLVGRARAAMHGRPTPTAPTLDADRRRLAERGDLSVLVETTERGAEILVAAPDRPGTLSRTAGVLALHLLDVRAAWIGNHAGMAVNRFVVASRFGRLPDAALLRTELARALSGDLDLTARLAEKERSYASAAVPRTAPTVHWFDDSAHATVVEIRAPDRIGLLTRVTAALESAGLDVRSARVSSTAGVAVDAFYVTGPGGRPVPDRDRAMLAASLEAAVRADVVPAMPA